MAVDAGIPSRHLNPKSARTSKNCRHPLFVSANECSVETTLIYLHIHDRPGAGAPSSLDLD
jgi:hypothetical protein